MIVLELGLIAVGAIFVIASFFLTDKLSPKDLTDIAERSEAEIKSIMDKELQKADDRIRDSIDEAVDGSLIKVERALDRETNEKIAGITDYSDTVMQDMHKLHDEVTFLYSMLNDRHDEMTKTAGDVQSLVKEVKAVQRRMDDEKAEGERLEAEFEAELDAELKKKNTPVIRADAPAVETAEPEQKDVAAESMQEDAPVSKNVSNNPAYDEILSKTRDGKTAVEIAEELHMGVGEVQLIQALYSDKEVSADEA